MPRPNSRKAGKKGSYYVGSRPMPSSSSDKHPVPPEVKADLRRLQNTVNVQSRSMRPANALQDTGDRAWSGAPKVSLDSPYYGSPVRSQHKRKGRRK